MLPKSLVQLSRCFELSKGSLFHYTSKETADQISSSNELWLTRCDSFSDEMEIEYGRSLLIDALDGLGERGGPYNFSPAIDMLASIMRSHYAMSFSALEESEYLLRNYGQTFIEFRPGVCTEIQGGGLNWSVAPDMTGSFKMYPAIMHMSIEQGCVIYEEQRIRKIVSLAAIAIDDVYSLESGSKLQTLSLFKLRECLAKCLMLFKRPEFSEEREVRVFAYPLQGSSTPLADEVRQANGRNVHFLRARIPGLASSCIRQICTRG